MSCRVMWDSNDDAGCLYDSVTETVFGRRFLGNGQEKCEAFLTWCLAEHGDPRKLDVAQLVTLQDEWLLALDSGCGECFAEPWEKCDTELGEHPRAPRKPRIHPGPNGPFTVGGSTGGIPVASDIDWFVATIKNATTQPMTLPDGTKYAPGETVKVCGSCCCVVCRCPIHPGLRASIESVTGAPLPVVTMATAPDDDKAEMLSEDKT